MVRYAVFVAIAGVALALSSSAGARLEAFPGGNGKIAFSGRTATGAWQIYVVEPGGKPKALTRTSRSDLDPTWSADGARIAFASNRRRPINFDLYIMEADGRKQRRLTRSPANDIDPVWSPDGARIAFSSDRVAGSFDIWTIKPNGRGQRRLTDSAGTDVDPAWSPDGTQIAFASSRERANFDIWVMNADGSDPHRVTGGLGQDLSPSWSPDGRLIAFDRRPPLRGDAELLSVDLATGNVRRLTRNRGDDLTPAWSPDGELMSFPAHPSCRSDCNFDLYISGGDGKNRQRIAARSLRVANPDWRPLPADMALVVLAAPEQASVGSEVGSSFDIVNTGPGISFGTIVNLAASGAPIVGFAPSQGTCELLAALVCQFGTLPRGATARLDVAVNAEAVGEVVLSAAITSSTADRVPDNNAVAPRTLIVP